MLIDKIAALDVGSNAVRMLIMHAYTHDHKTQYKKVSLIRVPVRLGASVFQKGYLEDEVLDRFIDALKAFKLLKKAHGIEHFRAYATSALRDAANGAEVIARVKSETGISIKIISGKKEAEIIYSNHIAELIDENSKCLYVDVGGGSTEVTIFDNHKRVDSKSFNIGAVRMLEHGVDDEARNGLKKFVKKARDTHQPSYLIGTGGNINKYYNLTKGKRRNNNFLDYSELTWMHQELSAMTVEERMLEFNLYPDRADVIVPAGKIFLDIMRWSKISSIYVSKAGLADGMVKEIHSELQSNTAKAG